MADTKRKKLPQITGPKGPFRFPKLNAPDKGNEKFPKPDGEYSLQQVFVIGSPEAQELIDLLTPLHQEAIAEAHEEFKKLPVGTRKKLGKVTENALFTTLYDKETEQETGEIAFKFAMKASGAYRKGHAKEGERWKRKPTIVDGRGKTMVKVPEIWGGTIGRVCFEVSPYFIPGTGAAGLKLSLVGVQVLKLVSAGGRTAESMGFGAEEDGYEYAEEAAEAAITDTDDTSDTGNF